MLDTTRIAKDQDGQIIDVPRDYSHLYPITVMADSYPSLNIQAHEFLKQSKVQDVPSVLEQPYFTDVFFIDILSELLSEPLMFIDYLDQRCRYDNSTCLLTEKGMLANYFINDFDFSSNAVKFAAPDELYYNVPEKIERINTIYELSGELESQVDMEMIRRRSNYPVEETKIGIRLDEIVDKSSAWLWFIDRFMRPEDNNELNFGIKFIHLPRQEKIQFQQFINGVCRQCRMQGPVNVANRHLEEDFQVLCVATIQGVPSGFVSNAINSIDDKEKKGGRFLLVFGAMDQNLIEFRYLTSE